MFATEVRAKVKALRCRHNKVKESVIIFVDQEGTLYADDVEHVPGDLTFFAAKRCTLFFEKSNGVFDRDEYELNEGENVFTPIASGSTAYAINVQPLPTKTGPIIVVP